MKYEIHSWINCIDSFKTPLDIDKWRECPLCGLKPKIWIFDNGRHTACGCWNDTYHHRSIQAESIMEHHKNNGNTANYDSDGLRKAWNNFCEGVEL